RGRHLAFAIGGAGVGRQGEGEVVVIATGIRARQSCAAGETRPCRAQIACDLRQHGLRIVKLKIDGLARVEQRGTDGDVVAEERLPREGIEAALKLASAVQPDLTARGAAGLVVAYQRALPVARDVESVDIAG